MNQYSDILARYRKRESRKDFILQDTDINIKYVLSEISINTIKKYLRKKKLEKISKRKFEFSSEIEEFFESINLTYIEKFFKK